MIYVFCILVRVNGYGSPPGGANTYFVVLAARLITSLTLVLSSQEPDDVRLEKLRVGLRGGPEVPIKRPSSFSQ